MLHAPCFVWLHLCFAATCAVLRWLAAERASFFSFLVEHSTIPAIEPCSICCRDAPAPPAAAVNCPARHAFCEPCIRQALTTPSAGGSRCPNCRAEVTELRCPPDAEQPEPVAPLAAAAEPSEEDFVEDSEVAEQRRRARFWRSAAAHRFELGYYRVALSIVQNVLDDDDVPAQARNSLEAFARMRYRGRTPLHFLAELTGDPVEVVHFLLRVGVPIDATGDDYGTTALHGACNRGNVRCAAALVAWGADLDAQDRTGLTPLEVARRERDNDPRLANGLDPDPRYAEIIHMLVTAGARDD